MRDLEKPGPVTGTRQGRAWLPRHMRSQPLSDWISCVGAATPWTPPVAACAVQCVVEPESTGIGGDNFCIYAPEGQIKDMIAFNGQALPQLLPPLNGTPKTA